MSTKFSQFNAGGAIVAGDVIVGLRAGVNTQFNAPALPVLPWSVIVVSQPLLINEGYFILNNIPQNFLLPVAANFGEILQIVNFSGVAFTITQSAHQQIQFGAQATTLGIGGSIQSTNIGDSLTLICNVPNTNFVLLGAPTGNWNIV